MQSSRVMPHARTGRQRPRGRAPSARVDTSKRTWSLPLPVQPWATASAPCSRAAATRCLTMTGRDSAETSGYLPSYRALALRAGPTKSRGVLLAAVDDDGLDRAGGQGPLAASSSKSPPWPTSAARAITSTPRSSSATAPRRRCRGRRCTPARLASPSVSLLAFDYEAGQGGQALGDLGPRRTLSTRRR